MITLRRYQDFALSRMLKICLISSSTWVASICPGARTQFPLQTIRNGRLLLRCGLDAKQRASELAMEIYARVPLIPQSLLISGLDSQIDYENLGRYYNGTLVNGEDSTNATLWPRRWGINVGHHPFSRINQF